MSRISSLFSGHPKIFQQFNHTACSNIPLADRAKPYSKLKWSLALAAGSLLSLEAFAIQCNYAVSNDWGSGFTANITVTNDGTSAINGWQVQWQQNGGSTMTSSWNATVSGSNPYTARPVDWNGTIAPGASQSFGLQGNGDNSTGTILGCTANGGTTSSRSSTPVSSVPMSSVPASSAPRSSTPASSIPASSIPASSRPASSTPASSSSSSRASTTELTLQENATGFCSVNGTIDTNFTGFTGSGFANSNNAVGSGVEWKVRVPAGEYQTLTWRYSNLSANNRAGRVLVNGVAVATVDFPTTGAWNSWTEASANILLNAGDNTIRLEAVSAEGLGNIDSLTVVGNSPQAVACGGASSSSSSSSSRGGPFKPKYILGAAITWTLEHESIGRSYADEGKPKSIERILVDHGFNFVRIRSFVCPGCEGGYTDYLYSGARHTEDWGDTAHTIKLAKRVKACGMGIYLNVMLSDNWTSIGRQERPTAWRSMNLTQMRTASYNYSKGLLDQMTAQGVRPDMVQCGNEVNTHVAGYSFNDWAGYSGIINSCIKAVRDTDPNIPVVLHHGRPRPDGNFPDWLNRVSRNNPPIDADIVCGSTYGTTNNGADWRDMFNLVIRNWGKRVMSCEYTDERRELVNNTFRNLPNDMGVGSFIWEPAGYGDKRPFDLRNNVYTTNASMDQYARIAREEGLPVPSTPASQLVGTSCQ